MTGTPTSAAERYCPSCERSFHDHQRCPDDGTELVVLAPRPDPLVGRALNDRYTVVEKLGAGGMGTVYRGTQHSVGRDVAIKVVSAGLVADPDAIKRFLREAKLASRLSHPNAVSVLDFGQTTDGVFFLVMELLVGRTLDKVLRAEGRLRLTRVVRIAQQIFDALEGAHRLSIVHRDLKPANVMLLDGSEDRDLVKVLDFGLAKSLSKDSTQMTVTVSGALLGTPAYMSPEAARGDAGDERSDLYSLGCMLYVLASGRLPFQSDAVTELLSMHSSMQPAAPPGVPAPVANVILRLLEKDPDARFRTAAAARHALDEASLPFIARDLEAAKAQTLAGRTASMPPDVATSATVDSSPASLLPRAAAAAALADHEAALAATITPPPVASQVAGAAARAPSEPTAAASQVAGAAARAPSEPTAAASQVAAAATSAPSVAAAVPAPRSRRGFAIAAVLALVVIAAGVGVAVKTSRTTPTAAPSEPTPPPTTPATTVPDTAASSAPSAGATPTTSGAPPAASTTPPTTSGSPPAGATTEPAKATVPSAPVAELPATDPTRRRPTKSAGAKRPRPETTPAQTTPSPTGSAQQGSGSATNPSVAPW